MWFHCIGCCRKARSGHGERRKNASFSLMKEMLLQDKALAHCNPDFVLVLATDSSSHVLRAVLSQRTPEGEIRPIALRFPFIVWNWDEVLVDRERGIVLGIECEDVSNVSWGSLLWLQTISPLSTYLTLGEAVPITAAARILRCCLFLGGFSYSIEFRGTSQHANSYCLSRLPRPQASAHKLDEVEMFHTTVVQALPVTEQELRMQTRRDPVLSRCSRVCTVGMTPFATK